MDGGGAGQCHGQRLSRGHGRYAAVAGLRGQGRIQDDPLVSKPHDRAMRLRELVHLLRGQRLPTHGDLPVEAEQGLAAEKDSKVRGWCPAAVEDDRGGQKVGLGFGPVKRHPDGSQPGRSDREQLVHLMVGQVEGTRSPGANQGLQRRPGPRGPPGANHQLDARLVAEPLVVAGPEVGPVDHQRRLPPVVNLQDRAEPARAQAVASAIRGAA